MVEWRKFQKGRARCKGRSKWERRAERYYARALGAQSRFTSTSLEMEARHLHQVRMLLAQMAATTATPQQMVREATNMLENMTDALLAFDGEMARSMDRQGPLHTLNRTITEDAKKQAPQFGETAAKTLVEAAAQQQWRH